MGEKVDRFVVETDSTGAFRWNGTTKNPAPFKIKVKIESTCVEPLRVGSDPFRVCGRFDIEKDDKDTNHAKRFSDMAGETCDLGEFWLLHGDNVCELTGTTEPPLVNGKMVFRTVARWFP